MPALSPKQRAFVAEYLIDLNATQAAIRAGYSPHTANPQASRLLSKVTIQDAVHEGFITRSLRTNVNQDFVLERLKVESHGDGEDTTSAARIRATELIGKHLGMFTDKVQVENVGPAPELRVVFGKAKEKQTEAQDD